VTDRSYVEQIRPPITYFGGKTRIARAIVDLLPAHEHYVEPFGGSLAVLLAKRPSAMETVNDINRALMTFWRVLRDRPGEVQLGRLAIGKQGASATIRATPGASAIYSLRGIEPSSERAMTTFKTSEAPS